MNSRVSSASSTHSATNVVSKCPILPLPRSAHRISLNLISHESTESPAASSTFSSSTQATGNNELNNNKKQYSQCDESCIEQDKVSKRYHFMMSKLNELTFIKEKNDIKRLMSDADDNLSSSSQPGGSNENTISSSSANSSSPSKISIKSFKSLNKNKTLPPISTTKTSADATYVEADSSAKEKENEKNEDDTDEDEAEALDDEEDDEEEDEDEEDGLDNIKAPNELLQEVFCLLFSDLFHSSAKILLKFLFFALFLVSDLCDGKEMVGRSQTMQIHSHVRATQQDGERVSSAN